MKGRAELAEPCNGWDLIRRLRHKRVSEKRAYLAEASTAEGEKVEPVPREGAMERGEGEVHAGGGKVRDSLKPSAGKKKRRERDRIKNRTVQQPRKKEKRGEETRVSGEIKNRGLTGVVGRHKKKVGGKWKKGVHRAVYGLKFKNTLSGKRGTKKKKKWGVTCQGMTS